MKKILLASLLLTMLVVTPILVSAKGQPDYAKAAKPGDMTIVGIVLQNDGEFDVLQAAVIKADLVHTLNHEDQYTVFAPTDQAFIDLLPPGSTEAQALAAVNAMNVSDLTNILLYHVTEGRRHSNSVMAAPMYEMLNGDYLMRSELVSAGIKMPDVSASNGIVHVIDSVLLP